MVFLRPAHTLSFQDKTRSCRGAGVGVGEEMRMRMHQQTSPPGETGHGGMGRARRSRAPCFPPGDGGTRAVNSISCCKYLENKEFSFDISLSLPLMAAL